jgi:hypothetical protein
MKCPVVIANEMSAFSEAAKRVKFLPTGGTNERRLLAGFGDGAGDEDSRGDLAGNRWATEMVSGGRDLGDLRSADAAMEDSV